MRLTEQPLRSSCSGPQLVIEGSDPAVEAAGGLVKNGVEPDDLGDQFDGGPTLALSRSTRAARASNSDRDTSGMAAPLKVVTTL